MVYYDWWQITYISVPTSFTIIGGCFVVEQSRLLPDVGRNQD